MFFVLSNRHKDKISFGFRVVITLVILGMVITHLYGMYNGYVFTSQGLLREDKPSGNPMRVEVENEQPTLNPLDGFVIKLREFYTKE